jgi:Flp pilus assembly secretin CpaC
MFATANTDVRYGSRSMHENSYCLDIKHIKNCQLVGTFWSTIHNNSMNSIASINSLDPNFFHNIKEANLQHFVNWTDEVKHNYTPILIGFPLIISIGLLDNQDISIVATETLCTITSFVHR